MVCTGAGAVRYSGAIRFEPFYGDRRHRDSLTSGVVAPLATPFTDYIAAGADVHCYLVGALAMALGLARCRRLSDLVPHSGSSLHSALNLIINIRSGRFSDRPDRAQRHRQFSCGAYALRDVFPSARWWRATNRRVLAVPNR